MAAMLAGWKHTEGACESLRHALARLYPDEAPADALAARLASATEVLPNTGVVVSMDADSMADMLAGVSQTTCIFEMDTRDLIVVSGGRARTASN